MEHGLHFWLRIWRLTTYKKISAAMSQAQLRAQMLFVTMARVCQSPLRAPLLLSVSLMIRFAPMMQASPVYEAFVFHPSKLIFWDCPSVEGVDRQDLYFAGKDGSMLHGWYFQVPGAQRTALISHGNGGNLTWYRNLIELMIKCRCSVFIYDYRGYGTSEGECSLSAVCEDGLSAYDYVVNIGHVDPKSLVLFGASLGGGITCHIAENRPCAAIILQSTFYSLDHVADKKAPFVQRHFPNIAVPPSLNNAQALAGTHPPVLLVHGERDLVVPCSETKLLFAAASQPKQLLLLPRVGHNNLLHRYLNRVADTITDFLSRLPSTT
jgi:fermentation-respiration switch protein FrsA (DUF1100 family)